MYRITDSLQDQKDRPGTASVNLVTPAHYELGPHTAGEDMRERWEAYHQSAIPVPSNFPRVPGSPRRISTFRTCIAAVGLLP